MFLGLVGSARAVVVVVVVASSKDAVGTAGRKWVSEEKRIRFPSERRHPQHMHKKNNMNNTGTMPSSILLPAIFVFDLVLVVVVVVFVFDRDGSG